MSNKRNLSEKVRGKTERNFIAAGTLSIKIIFELKIQLTSGKEML